MRTASWPVRLAAAAGTAGLLAVPLAAPAAAQGDPFLTISLGITEVPIHFDEASGGIDGPVHVDHNDHPDLPDHLTVVVDASDVADVLAVTVTGGDCVAVGPVTTCVIPLPSAAAPAMLRTNFQVLAGAQVGDGGEIVLTASGEGVDPAVEVELVQIVGEPHFGERTLLSQDLVHPGEIAPGEVVSYRPVIHHAGDTVAEIVGLEFADDHAYLRHTQRFGNCRYRDGGSTAYCEFELDLAPGETARVAADTPIELRVQPNVPSRALVGASYFADGFDSPLQGDLGEFGDGPELRLERVTGVEFEGARFASFRVQAGPNSADIAAIGAGIHGATGDVTTVEVGLTNHGPADVPGALDGEGLSPDAPDQPAIEVRFPDGVAVLEFVGDPEQLGFRSGICAPVVDGTARWERIGEPGASHYRCTRSATAEAGQDWRFAFRVEITGSRSASGEVVAAGGADDPVPGNNTAPVTLTVGDPKLAATGTTVRTVAAAGGLALAAGAALLLVVRRRPAGHPG